MVHVAPPDAGRGRRRVPRHRARQPRLRAVRPAAGGRGGHLGGPRRRRAGHPRRPLRPQGVPGGQGLRRHAGVRLRAATPGPHPRRHVPGHPLQPGALQLRHHAGGVLHPALARARQAGGRLRPLRRPPRGAHHLHPLLPQRRPHRGARAGDHGPRRPLHAAAAVVHRGGPRRLHHALREVRLPLPSPDTLQGSAQDDKARGPQVPGAGVHGDGGEGLLLQVPWLRDRHEERRHEHLRDGPQDHLHPGGMPLRAGAVPGPDQ